MHTVSSGTHAQNRKHNTQQPAMPSQQPPSTAHTHVHRHQDKAPTRHKGAPGAPTEPIRVSVDVLCVLHDCALGISPVTSYSGVKSLYIQRPSVVTDSHPCYQVCPTVCPKNPIVCLCSILWPACCSLLGFTPRDGALQWFPYR